MLGQTRRQLNFLGSEINNALACHRKPDKFCIKDVMLSPFARLYLNLSLMWRSSLARLIRRKLNNVQNVTLSLLFTASCKKPNRKQNTEFPETDTMQQLLPVGSGHKRGSDRGRSQCLAEGVVIGPGETSMKHLFPLCCHKGTCDVVK